MSKHELIISEQAVHAFRDIIRQTQGVSLVSAERVRNKILHKLHGLQHHPEQGSKSVDDGLGNPCHFVTVLNYRIYFTIEDGHVYVHDMLADKK